MSRLFEWADSVVARMRYFDVAATKLAVLLFTIFLVKLWPNIAAFDWRIYLIGGFVIAMPTIFRLFERGMITFTLVVYLAIYLAVEFLTTL